MEQSKIVKYLAELPAKSRERFRQFALSPYFNQHDQTTELIGIILEALDQPKLKLNRQKIFRKLFPGEEFDEQRLHNLLSYVKKLYVRFLAYEEMERYPFLEPVLALEGAYERNQFDLLINRSKYLEKVLKKHPYRDSQHHYARYRVNYLLGYYKTKYVDRSKNERFQHMLNHLDRYYIAEKLRNCCHLTANMILMNAHYDFYLLEELLTFIRNNWGLFKNDTSIQLYYTILMSLRQDKEPVHYQRLKEMLTNQIHCFPPEEQSDLYLFSYNYCIVRINEGQEAYQQELFQLYKQGLKSELLLNNGLLYEWDYKNITTLGCALKEFEWTENFIEEYREKLPANHRENAYNYNLANLYHSKRMYNEAIQHLLQVRFTDVKYHLSTSFLTLRTYYELGDTEALLSLIETFRIYAIRNRSITTDQKRGLTNFLRFARRLVNLKHQSYTYSEKALNEKLQKLYGQIEQTDNVFNKKWLLDESKVVEEKSEVEGR